MDASNMEHVISKVCTDCILSQYNDTIICRTLDGVELERFELPGSHQLYRTDYIARVAPQQYYFIDKEVCVKFVNTAHQPLTSYYVTTVNARDAQLVVTADDITVSSPDQHLVRRYDSTWTLLSSM